MYLSIYVNTWPDARLAMAQLVLGGETNIGISVEGISGICLQTPGL